MSINQEEVSFLLHSLFTSRTVLLAQQVACITLYTVTYKIIVNNDFFPCMLRYATWPGGLVYNTCISAEMAGSCPLQQKIKIFMVLYYCSSPF